MRRRNAWLGLTGGFLLGFAGTLAVWNRSRRSPDFISRAGIGRTFQNIRLFSGMTVLENVLTGMDRDFRAGIVRMALRTPAARREEAAARAKAMEWLRLVGLESRAGNLLARNFPMASSGGWRLPGRWRPSRACCCWTNRRLA